VRDQPCDTRFRRTIRTLSALTILPLFDAYLVARFRRPDLGPPI